MNPCAWCLCTGSALPGGYSTVIICASLPGSSGSGLVMSGTTTASRAWLDCVASDQQTRATGSARPLSIDIWGTPFARDRRTHCLIIDHALLDGSGHELNGNDNSAEIQGMADFIKQPTHHPIRIRVVALPGVSNHAARSSRSFW